MIGQTTSICGYDATDADARNGLGNPCWFNQMVQHRRVAAATSY